MGMQVETSFSTAGFWYDRKFQGYIWGEHANKIDAVVSDAQNMEHVTHTLAYDYVPYYNPTHDVAANAKMDLAVAMLDPEFRADVEKLEAVCSNPEQSAALQTIVAAALVVDTVEDVIDQAEQIIAKVTAGEDVGAVTAGEGEADSRSGREADGKHELRYEEGEERRR